MPKVIDFNHAKLLKESDAQLTVDNFDIRLKFVEHSSELVKIFLENSDSFILSHFKASLPREVISSFDFLRFFSLKAVDDLNLMAQVEAKLGVKLAIFPPGFAENDVGWLAVFNFDGFTFSSPELKTEALARAFSILLFLKLKNSVVKANK